MLFTKRGFKIVCKVALVQIGVAFLVIYLILFGLSGNPFNVFEALDCAEYGGGWNPATETCVDHE